MQTINTKLRLVFLFSGTLFMILVMAKSGASLKTPATPGGILDLEFARDSAKASGVINAWTGTGAAGNIDTAKINTWLDFIFLFFYSLFLYEACKWLASLSGGFLCITGRFLAKASVIAGLLDILENAGMLISLQGHLSDGCTLLTFIFSVAKWIMVLTAAGYVLIAGLTLLYRKMTKTV